MQDLFKVVISIQEQLQVPVAALAQSDSDLYAWSNELFNFKIKVRSFDHKQKDIPFSKDLRDVILY